MYKLPYQLPCFGFYRSPWFFTILVLPTLPYLTLLSKNSCPMIAYQILIILPITLPLPIPLPITLTIPTILALSTYLALPITLGLPLSIIPTLLNTLSHLPDILSQNRQKDFGRDHFLGFCIAPQKYIIIPKKIVLIVLEKNGLQWSVNCTLKDLKESSFLFNSTVCCARLQLSIEYNMTQ